LVAMTPPKADTGRRRAPCGAPRGVGADRDATGVGVLDDRHRRASPWSCAARQAASPST
jgi:hypothetical protein